MSISELIRSRRSVYPNQYSGEKVPDEIILEALENANCAPNHGKTEPWRFILFKEESLLKLAQFQADLYKMTTAPGLFKPTKYQKFFDKANNSSHIIAIVHHRNEPNKIPLIEEYEAIGCAVQNFHLTISSKGLGGYWSTGGVYNEEMKAFLQLAPNQNCFGLFYIGVPNVIPKPRERGALQDKVKWF